MKIALLTDGIFPYVVGGMQKHSLLLCRYLVQAGHTVLLVHTADADLEAEARLLATFSPEERTRIEAHFVPFPRLPRFPFHYILANYLYSREIGKALFREIRQCDFVYAQGLTGWWFGQKNRKKRPDLIVNLHGLEMFQPAADRKSALIHALIRPFFRRVLRDADGVQSLGGKLTPILRQQGVAPQAIFECGIGIEREWLVPLPLDPPRVAVRKCVFIGRFERRKGVEELSAALLHMAASGVPFEMHMIGPIPEECQLALPQVIYRGLIRDQEIIRTQLQASDILVCPSYSEGMPTVILEAMACGCAIVATDVGATAALVDDTTGWLIPPGNGDALADALTQALTCDASSLLAKKEAAVARISASFCWDQVVSVTLSQIAATLHR